MGFVFVVINLMAWQPLVIDRETVERAWGIMDRFNYAWWDALIIAAKLILECDYLLTEDLQENQVIDNLTIINPVLTTIPPYPTISGPRYGLGRVISALHRRGRASELTATAEPGFSWGVGRGIWVRAAACRVLPRPDGANP